jgi:hypothetical protein
MDGKKRNENGLKSCKKETLKISKYFKILQKSIKFVKLKVLKFTKYFGIFPKYPFLFFSPFASHHPLITYREIIMEKP